MGAWITYNSALSTCKNFNARLLTVKTEDKYKFVVQYLSTITGVYRVFVRKSILAFLYEAINLVITNLLLLLSHI